MLVSTELLTKFSGVYPEDTNLSAIYINSASQIITDYVGFNPETNEDWKQTVIVDDEETEVIVIPDIFKLVCLEIATLIQAEQGSNIGVNSSVDTGVSRSYLNIVDYTKYLQRLSIYRKGDTVKM